MRTIRALALGSSVLGLLTLGAVYPLYISKHDVPWLSLVSVFIIGFYVFVVSVGAFRMSPRCLAWYYPVAIIWGIFSIEFFAAYAEAVDALVKSTERLNKLAKQEAGVRQEVSDTIQANESVEQDVVFCMGLKYTFDDSVMSDDSMLPSGYRLVGYNELAMPLLLDADGMLCLLDGDALHELAPSINAFKIMIRSEAMQSGDVVKMRDYLNELDDRLLRDAQGFWALILEAGSD